MPTKGSKADAFWEKFPDPPDHYSVGDSLDWNAPWINVEFWVELPFWLMVHNSAITVPYEGCTFNVTVENLYWELAAKWVTDSKASVIYRGPHKEPQQYSEAVKEFVEQHPEIPIIWRKCKTILKIESRCNADVWMAYKEDALPRCNEARLYLSELCRAHIPIVNSLVRAYRLSSYDYFAFEVSPWDIPHWSVNSNGVLVSITLVKYKDWDHKPLLHRSPEAQPEVYNLIHNAALQAAIKEIPSPGELELMDALNLMERGDYSGAVRRITTAIEVVVEAVTEQAVQAAQGAPAAKAFIRKTRMRFDERVREYQKIMSRQLDPGLLKILEETRALRHKIVHAGYRIAPHEQGKAQKAVDTGRWIYNWFENQPSKQVIREGQVALRSLGRDITAGMFRVIVTTGGVALVRN